VIFQDITPLFVNVCYFFFEVVFLAGLTSTASFRVLPGLNLGTILLGISIVC
jgi:hypothetical protein